MAWGVLLAVGSNPIVPPKHKNLFGDIASFTALHDAAKQAVKGKRKKPGAAKFLANLERELLRLQEELWEQRYRSGRYLKFQVHDSKTRTVSAAPFRDRVVHHALYAVIEPIFERGFVADSYANRIGKGTHGAVERYEMFRDRFTHVLRCDIFRYFPAIDHEILKADLRRRVGCEQTLWLLDTIIDGSNPQEPVYIHYPGDDLLTPVQRRRGLPIGNLTSQFFANVFLDCLDHFCKEVLGAKGYVRYVDDFALFHDSPHVLERWRNQIDGYLAGRRLSLHPRKTFIISSSEPAQFLGFVLQPGGGRRLPEDNVRRFRNRLRGLRDGHRAGTVDLEDVQRRVGGWIAHAEHANTWRLRRAIFHGGIFDPALEPDFRDGHCGPKRKPGRPPDAVWCAAAPGTTTPGTFVQPNATGTIPTTGTTTKGCGLPARPYAGAGAFKDAPGVQKGVQGRS